VPIAPPTTYTKSANPLDPLIGIVENATPGKTFSATWIWAIGLMVLAEWGMVKTLKRAQHQIAAAAVGMVAQVVAWKFGVWPWWGMAVTLPCFAAIIIIENERGR
jgi:hypothetical protein